MKTKYSTLQTGLILSADLHVPTYPIWLITWFSRSDKAAK